MTTLLSILAALARPVATCLGAGALKTLEDYQGGQHWGPALVDGGITAITVAGAIGLIGGAVAGVQQARAQVVANAANGSAK